MLHRLFLFVGVLSGFGINQSLLANPNVSNSNTVQQNVILILDASGSMWGQIDKTPKIDIARDAISKLLAKWDKSTKIGVVAYGHRRKGDCTDIQTLAPLAIVNPGKITEMLDDLTPKGKTPLGASVQKAAELLKSNEEASTVILVSDGLETCGMDPCAIAKTLKENDINFKVHVIGFDVANLKNVSKLECIAKNTGGRYFSASNAAELNNALRIVRKVAAAKTIKKIPEKVVQVKKVGVNYTEYGLNLKFKCNSISTLRISKKVSLDKKPLKCVNIIVQAGGNVSANAFYLYDSVITIEKGGAMSGKESYTNNSVIIVKNGSSLTLNGDSHRAIINLGGTIKLEGTIEYINSLSGTISMKKGNITTLESSGGKIMLSTEVSVENNKGKIPVELTL